MSNDQYYYRLDQLAGLGLPNQIFIPALLQELHHHISSFSNTFCWQNDQGKLSHIYDELQNTKTISNLINSMSSITSNKYDYTNKWVNHLDKPISSLEHYGKCPYITDFYKTILRPMGYINSCFIPVRHSETNKRLGLLIIHRQKSKFDFTPQERCQLQHIATIIALTLNNPQREKLYTTDGWDQGLLIINQDGQLQYACSEGQKLLSLASSSRFGTSAPHLPKNLHIFSGLDRLIEELAKLTNGSNPTLTTINSWGEFKLRGFLIHDVSGHRGEKIGLNIRWQEPFVLKLFHRIKNIGLTPRQETVALFYATGDPLKLIALKLGLSIYTVKDHVKNLLERLHISSRADLIEIILCDTKPTNQHTT